MEIDINKLAKALFWEHCKGTTIYLRNDVDIQTAWDAEPKERRRWVEVASRVKKEYEKIMGK